MRLGEKSAGVKDLQPLLREKGRLFSDDLGIAVAREPFPWLVAAILFGHRISATIAKRTYKALARRHLLTPRAILRAGRDELIEAMGEGGYVRYDNMTSDFLIGLSQRLLDEYGGKAETIHNRAATSADLERALLAFKGVGPVTLNIFLRELRGVWAKADPPLSKLAVDAARAFGLITSSDPVRALAQLKALWQRASVPGYDLRHLEAALVRAGLERRHRQPRRT